jgi:hypothetical protein
VYLLIVIDGLWAILSRVIFPASKFLKRHTTDQSVQEQFQIHPETKLTRQDKFNLFTREKLHSEVIQLWQKQP